MSNLTHSTISLDFLKTRRVESLLSAHSSHSEQSSTTPSWGGCFSQGFAPAPCRMRTAQTIEENKSSESREVSKKKPIHPNSLKNLKPYVPGQTGNPGGKPKVDHAQAIARAIFENDSEAIYKAFAKALRSGNAYSFSVLADRAFGKLKEKVEHSGDEELLAALAAGRKRIGDGSTTA